MFEIYKKNLSTKMGNGEKVLNMDILIIGKNVRTLRNQAGLTQAQLAEAIDKSTIHVSHIENGLTNISLECLLALCAALKTTPNTILQGNYTIPSPEHHNLLIDSPYYSIAADDAQNFTREIADMVAERLEK